ncbi:MAG: hypothetical protein Q4B00_07875 [Eubacteriales bacterium]|nr:hypothetical protein [Eubacteriales bacterium]
MIVSRNKLGKIATKNLIVYPEHVTPYYLADWQEVEKFLICIPVIYLILEDVPEDYEVIIETTTGCDTKAGTSIAYINGVKRDEEFK